MAKGDLIRVPGYSQKIIYNGNIEYRNFSDNLVGNQSIVNINNNNESSSLFTMGNFVVTTSSSNKSDYSFKGKNFTQFYDLSTLNFTNNVEKLINSNVDIKLNLDNNKLSSYAYFGSATEFIRVTLENIITYWPASLYVNPILTTAYGDFTGLTVENYIYDAYNDKSSFDINVTFINNNFELVFTQNGNVIDTFNADNKLRNVTINYNDYVIDYNNLEYNVLEFTGSTNEVSGYINIVVEGDPFKDITTTATSRTSIYHIRPNKLKVDEFFNKLNSFEQNILNRYTLPKYTSTYDYDRVGSNNIIYKSQKSITWPISDGYNIDFSTNDYVRYVGELIEMATSSDKVSSDILTRFLVSDSIADFDSLPKLDGTLEVTSGQKMTKILKIYGRNFDEVKIWMDGLKFFNTVTYDKKNNTPDQLVKGLAKNLGWELTTALSDNDLLKHYVETNQSTYSGQSTGLSTQQAETEMWRRLILNSAWLFKSKGSRKSIEFFFKFLGIPKGLVDLNEYIYKAKNRLNMNLFYAILERFNLSTDLSLYNVDNEGFPKFPAQTGDMFFQKSGLWYRQTSGVGTSEHILTGNNPHIGPYDGGQSYLLQLNNLIPNFTPFTITNQVKLTGSTNLFYNYNKGKMNYYSGQTYVNTYNTLGVPPTNCLTTTTSIIPDPYPNYKETICGCPCEVDDDILSVCLKKRLTNNNTCTDCTTKVVYNPKGNGGVIFKTKESETCGLTISLDYMLNFDCDLFSKVCGQDAVLITQYNTTINDLYVQIDTKQKECDVITNQLNNANILFSGLCYVIAGMTTSSIIPINYCLTTKGLELWETILGAINYADYISSFDCNLNSYTQTNFKDFYKNVLINVKNDSSLKVSDFMVATVQQTCDKKVANDDVNDLIIKSNKCAADLVNLNNQLTAVKTNLNALKATNPNATPLTNLENLQVYLNLEVETTPNVYKSIYEESIFNIGTGNLMDYIINQSPNTGIFISGTTAGGILTSPFNSTDTNQVSTQTNCEVNRDGFIKELYLSEYKGNYPDPTTPDEQLALNKKMNDWYTSSWLYYNKTLDETIVSQILFKKIRISLRVENCCLDLCILTDNLALTKTCEILDNEEIIISESPKFEIEKVLDNRKSWVSYTETTGREHDLQFRETQYSVDDYRLTINTKEIDLKIDGSNAIEEDVLCIVDCLISGTTGTTISGTCCPDKCDLGYITDFTDLNKMLNKGKFKVDSNGYKIGYSIKKPSFTALDTYYVPVITPYDSTLYYKSLNDQGIWLPIYPNTNVHYGCSNPAQDIVQSSISCDLGDYTGFNRAARDESIKSKYNLLLGTPSFDWSNLDIPNFQIEKYYLNKSCSTSEYRVGEAAYGGTVAYVDGTGQHGLIYGNYNYSSPIYWHVSDNGLVNATGDALYAGIVNTTTIVSAYGAELNAAKYCSNYSNAYSDWYLPSKYELNIISQNWADIGVKLKDSNSYVWTSTENNLSTAWAQNIYNGTQAIYNKSTILGVILVRKF
jgi:hypothetical protein